MMTIFRHTLSILLLPFMVVVVIPYWLLNTFPAGYTDPVAGLPHLKLWEGETK